MPAPSWLSLLSPLPADVVPQRKPVASAEQIEKGTAGPIAGWQNVMVNLSEPDYGLRHVQVTLNENGQLLSGSDLVMFVRETTPDGCEALLTDHESIGGRFETDGSFRGTHWTMTLETGADGDDEQAVARRSESRPPAEEEIAALRRVIEDVLARCP
jgi:hypothetical protein